MKVIEVEAEVPVVRFVTSWLCDGHASDSTPDNFRLCVSIFLPELIYESFMTTAVGSSCHIDTMNFQINSSPSLTIQIRVFSPAAGAISIQVALKNINLTVLQKSAVRPNRMEPVTTWIGTALERVRLQQGSIYRDVWGAGGFDAK